MKKIAQKIPMTQNKSYFSGLVPALLSVLVTLLMAGCSGMSNMATGDTQLRNEVEMIRIPFMVSFEKGASQLSGDAIEKLDMFLMKSNAGYGDELSMDFPLQRDGKLSEQNRKRMAFLSELMKKRGLRLAPEVTPYGMSPATNKARFLISRYVVTPPRCGDWSQPSTDNYGNAPTVNFGCANQADLGLMVANPRDLITGVTGGQPDATRVAKAVYNYRTKKPAKSTSVSTTRKSK